MFLVTTNKRRNLVLLTLAGQVTAPEMRDARLELERILGDLQPEFTFVTDFTNLEQMEDASAPEIGKVMEALEGRLVSLIIRVMPDPTKDIGMNILSRFHYDRPPRTATCPNMAEAIKMLAS